jgi:hypothetical protein
MLNDMNEISDAKKKALLRIRTIIAEEPNDDDEPSEWEDYEV